MIRIPLIAGNWKMYKTTAEAKAFAEEFSKLYKDTDVRAAICAPFTQLAALKEAFAGTNVKLGAQNVHFEDEGAFTGEISVEMLKEIGVDYCIIGHSERREYFAETDETVNLKLKKLFSSSEIIPILCVGENLSEREAGNEFDVVEGQLKGDLEGIDKADVSKQAGEMCAHIRNIVEKLYDEDTCDSVIIQYGGSVKPENASEIMNMDEIDGALVGGASLDASKFIKIVNF